MAGKERVTGGTSRHSEKIRNAAAIAAALALLGIMGALNASAAQGFGLNQGVPGQNQGAVTQNSQQSRFPDNSPHFPKPTQRQKQALLDSNFKKLKQHAGDLAELAKSLQAEVDKSNENVLSIEIIKKANEVEKLAKKIKDDVKGY